MSRAMPRVRVGLPDELLQRAGTRAEELGKPMGELCADAIARYVEVNKHASAGSLRSRGGAPVSAQLTVEIPEELFQRAEKLAEALARHMAQVQTGDSALNQGHDLPSGAWRARDSG